MGHLGGSGDTVPDYRFWGREFKTHIGHGAYLRKKKSTKQDNSDELKKKKKIRSCLKIFNSRQRTEKFLGSEGRTVREKLKVDTFRMTVSR